MKQNASERFAIAISQLLDRIYKYCTKQIENELIFGACTVNPKHASVPSPTQTIQKELESRATTYFMQTEAVGYYFRYWTPPIRRKINLQGALKPISADDYQMTLEIPRFDDQWEQITLARSLIYCPLDFEHHGWNEWFELQLEAIRLTPLLHQSLKELQIKFRIKTTLTLPAKPIFQSFVFEYGLSDPHFPEMTKKEKDLWRAKQVDWKIRYWLAVDVVKPAETLHDLYVIARKKVASTRNPMLKALFGYFVDRVELELIMNTELPEKEKLLLIKKLRGSKEKASKEKYQAKRPALCISDLECGQMLYLLKQEFLIDKAKNKANAEAILFILIAQHAAFSGLQLKEKDILSIKMNDINHQNLTIQVKSQEINITGGFNEILVAWVGDGERKNQRLLFQNLTYDNLEDIISKCSAKFYGPLNKLLPKDFLEKVHVIAGIRIPIEIRRQITEQEKLVKAFLYRIDSREIKKQIKESFQQKAS